MDTTHAVVVSHAAADNALCAPYVAALQAMGLDLYYQPDMPQFGYLSAEVQQELRERKNLLVLLTQNAIESLWVKREMKSFLDLMKGDSSRKMILAQIAPCQVQAGDSPNVTLINATEMPFERAVDTIAGALGKAILTTESPATQRVTRLSRRGLLAAGLAGAVALGGGGAWWLTHMASHDTATAGPNTPDPGTPQLTWTPFGGKDVNFPLKYRVPFATIDLIDLYRIDTTIGGFSFADSANGNSDPSVGCVISDIPLIFGSRYHTGEYFVVTSRCFSADTNAAPTTGGQQPLDSLVVTYTFGAKGAAPPCGAAGDGTRVCLPTENAALIEQVSDAEALATVRMYYETIRLGSYQTAYNLLGRAAQARQTVADFAQHWQVGPITLQPDFSAVGQNGDGSVTLALSYTQELADGTSLWRATAAVQYESGQLRVLPLSRYKIIGGTTPTPAVTQGTFPQ